MRNFARPTFTGTRLTRSDYQRLSRLAQVRKITAAEVIRDAVIEYLNRIDADQANVVESVYAERLKGSTNRICAMLYKIALDVRTLLNFFLAVEPANRELMIRAKADAHRQISKALSDDEKAAVVDMTKRVSAPPTSAEQ